MYIDLHGLEQPPGSATVQRPLPKDLVLSATITRVLHARFRTEFADFRREMRKALGRYVTFRSDQGAFLDQLLAADPANLQNMKAVHNWNLTENKTSEFSPAQFGATFRYGSNFNKVAALTVSPP